MAKSRTIKVILKKSIHNIGLVGAAVEVKPGFAFNYLLAKNLAVISTKEHLEDFNKRKEEILKQNNEEKDAAELVAKEIRGKTVFLGKSVNDAGVLYGSVSQIEVANALNEQFKESVSHTFEPSEILMQSKIKSYGVSKVDVILYYEVKAVITLIVSKTVESAKTLLEEIEKEEQDRAREIEEIEKNRAMQQEIEEAQVKAEEDAKLKESEEPAKPVATEEKPVATDAEAKPEEESKAE